MGTSALLLLTASFSTAQAALLAKVEADVDGSGQKKIVELTGDKKMPGSNYYSNLWIMIKNADGKMLTAWKADLDGGYYCLLEKMPVNSKAEQKINNTGIDTKQNDAASEKKNNNAQEDTEKRFENLLNSLEELGNVDKDKTKNKITDKPHDQILLMAAKGGKMRQSVAGL